MDRLKFDQKYEIKKEMELQKITQNNRKTFDNIEQFPLVKLEEQFI